MARTPPSPYNPATRRNQTGRMTDILPQQQLLLELLVMSDGIAVAMDNAKGILWRTLTECEQNGWLVIESVNADYAAAEASDAGRALIKEAG